MSTDLIWSDATELAELIRTKQASSVEVVRAHLDRVEATNPKVNPIVTLAEGALEAAKASSGSGTVSRRTSSSTTRCCSR
ncbi:hypothetical protein [Amycolatopsis sp. NPDC051061]|uniref:hypothetical protein n=1 Tax=Amycolatopsis sp. NPDC051061 TaxID=3155042 RepID=UPI003436F722